MIASVGAETPVSASGFELPDAVDYFWSPDRVRRLRMLRNEGRSFRQIGDTMGVSRSAIASRLRRMRDDPLLTYRPKAMNVTVPSGRKPRAAPEGFATVAAKMTERAAARFYGVSHGMISRWKKSAALQAPARGIPAPEGFASYAPTATIYTLASHFGVDRRVVQRWCREAGIEAKRTVATFVSRGNRMPAAPVVHRDLSRAGGAAAFLQRYGPVYRCHPNGAASKIGSHWSRAGHVLTDAEIVERAERLGYDADAWRKVA